MINQNQPLDCYNSIAYKMLDSKNEDSLPLFWNHKQVGCCKMFSDKRTLKYIGKGSHSSEVIVKINIDNPN